MMSDFTENEIKIALLLATGKSVIEVAEIVGVNRKTIQRLKKKDGFDKLIIDSKTDKYKDVENKLDVEIEKHKPVIIKNVIAEIVEKELEELSRDKLKEIYLTVSNNLIRMGEKLRVKLEEHIDNIDEISPRLYAQYAKSYQDIVQAPIAINKLLSNNVDDEEVRIVVDFNDDTPPFLEEGNTTPPTTIDIESQVKVEDI
ncbi:helix-turn-helix domain-containing protein [Nostoc linckia]|nr:helix-turn-helix domain-containing protein [Nostoc linckia]